MIWMCDGCGAETETQRSIGGDGHSGCDEDGTWVSKGPNYKERMPEAVRVRCPECNALELFWDSTPDPYQSDCGYYVDPVEAQTEPLVQVSNVVAYLSYQTTVAGKAVDKIRDRLTSDQEAATFATNFQEMLEEAICETIEEELASFEMEDG
jgi:hypothetical protein